MTDHIVACELDRFFIRVKNQNSRFRVAALEIDCLVRFSLRRVGIPNNNRGGCYMYAVRLVLDNVSRMSLLFSALSRL